MVGILLWALVGLLVGLIVLWHIKRPPRWSEPGTNLRPAALTLGLEYQPQGPYGATCCGEIDGLSVRIEADEDSQRTSIVISALGHRAIHPELKLCPETWLGLDKALQGADWELGDSELDRQWVLYGPEQWIVALLDEDTRRLLKLMNVRVEQGALWFVRTGHDDPAEIIVTQVHALVTLAERLVLAPEEIAGRLATNALKDPNATIRSRNLRLLLRDFPTSPEAALVAEHALTDEVPELRLAAAERQNTEATRQVLSALALDSQAPPLIAAQALAVVVERSAPGDVLPIVEAALRSCHAEVRCAGARAAGMLGDDRLLMPLCDLAEVGGASEQAAAAGALARFVDTRGEPALIALLGQPDTGVRAAAAMALGTVGTARAVEPLLRMANEWKEEARTKRVARDSIRRIQSRLGPVEAGRITVAAPADADGALSLAQDAGETASTHSELPRR